MKRQKTTKTFVKKFLITSILATGFLLFGQTKSMAQVYAQMNYTWDGTRSYTGSTVYDVWTIDVSFYSDAAATGTPLYTLTSGFPVIQRDYVGRDPIFGFLIADSTPYYSVDFTSVFAYYYQTSNPADANGQWWELDPSATTYYSIATDPVNDSHGAGIAFPWYGL